MSWLREIPMAVVAAHVEMLPRLRAEDSLRMTATAAVARQLKPGAWSKRQLTDWGREAQSRRRGPARRGTAADLAQSGIGIRTVKRG